jgi:hypothetical protein
VNASEHDTRSRGFGSDANLVAAKRVQGMDADADDVSGNDPRRHERRERFIGEERIAVFGGRCGGEHVHPPGRDDADAE